MATKTKKLTKTQAELLWNLKHALPAGLPLFGHGHISKTALGTIWAGHNNSRTITGLAETGAIEIVRMGHSLPDEVRLNEPVPADRRVTIGETETHPSRMVGWVQIKTRTRNTVAYLEKGWTRDMVVAAFVADGWVVAEGV